MATIRATSPVERFDVYENQKSVAAGGRTSTVPVISLGPGRHDVNDDAVVTDVRASDYFGWIDSGAVLTRGLCLEISMLRYRVQR